jgi:hypothetical protein
MKSALFIPGFYFCLIPLMLLGQQIDIPRVQLMPDFPQPYQMREWKQIAQGYDSLVFNHELQGQYQPFVFFRNQTVNYPGNKSFGLHTAVGTNSPSSGEAINVIPAVVGATLVGINKSEQFGQNWALMIREYFNNRPQENIYLNHPVSNSGYDWWYETMPNVFYMQLRDLYPEIEIFQQQLPVMANQWVRAVKEMGASDTPWTIPYMNYRAWNMAEMEPLDQGVKQPEAAGAIAWILYNSYISTGDKEYLKAAEWAMEFLNNWQQNPSYELQLPYGIYTAARMNAEIGTSYDIKKMLNWSFNRGALRGWGTITGNWGGYDVDGLIGEANDTGNDYAFMMNGYQHAAALVPMVRYDYRFARAIGKWMLNLANASRLYYPAFLPDDMQDNASWSQLHDPDSYIGYEALREVKNGKSPYMTGDAISGGWAQTNLMLYTSSHVGYLAAIVDTTNVEGILQLDLLKTDFYAPDAFPTWLYYNPFDEAREIDLYLNEGNYKIYDVISKQLLLANQSGKAVLMVPANGVIMAVVVPESAVIETEGNKTFADDIIIDFNNGLATGHLPPRLKALAAVDTVLTTGSSTQIFATAHDPQESALTYHWYVPFGDISGSEQILFNAPAETGEYTIACKVSNEMGLSDSLLITIKVVDRIPYDPVINSLNAQPRKLRPEETTQITCDAIDFYGDPITFFWTTQFGEISSSDSVAIFTAPSEPGNYFVKCMVSNSDGLSATDSVLLMVREFDDQSEGNLIAHYPLRGDANDYSGNQLNGLPSGGITYTMDNVGRQNFAAFFNGSSANILLPGSTLFDFREGLSVAAFIKLNEVTAFEQHPISHGSWEHRFKISISNQRIRFTINTTSGIVDLDSESLIEPGKWYQLAVVYNREDMEIWLNGELDAFVGHSGLINISPLQPVLGQNVPGNNNFNFYGAMSLVSIYDFALSPTMIEDHLALLVPDAEISNPTNIILYPNPFSSGLLHIKSDKLLNGPVQFQLMNVNGQILQTGLVNNISGNILQIGIDRNLKPGIYFLKVLSADQVWVKSVLLASPAN